MYEIPGFCISMKADAAVDKKYVFVKATATGMDVATAETDVVIGVVQREGNLGEVLPVMNTGIAMVRANGSIAKGAKVKPTTGGYADTATGVYWGVALEAASNKEDIIPVLLMQSGAGAAAGG